MKALITGSTGFVGPHLASLLVRKEFEVTGLGLRKKSAGNLDTVPGNVSVVDIDIRDYAAVRRLLADVRPDHVYHLAAISKVVTSFKDPRLTYDINVGGTLNLFEAIRELNLKPRILHVSTAHVYRSIETESGLVEDSAVSLLTPYATSKFMSEALAAQYFEAYGFQIMTVRPFNHIGPGQPTGFVCSDFARQIAAIKLGKAEPVLRVGNLTAVRDFTDVRDVVEAYWAVTTKGIAGQVYNVSSHCPVSIQEILSMLCDLAGFPIRVEPDPRKFRPIETLRLFGDSTKLRALKWAPHIALKQTLKDILDYWVTVLSESTSETDLQ